MEIVLILNLAIRKFDDTREKYRVTCDIYYETGGRYWASDTKFTQEACEGCQHFRGRSRQTSVSSRTAMPTQCDLVIKKQKHNTTKYTNDKTKFVQ